MKTDCPECEGRGEIRSHTVLVYEGEELWLTKPCPACSGSGKAKEVENEK